MKLAHRIFGWVAIAILALAPGCATQARTTVAEPKTETIVLARPTRTAAASEAAAIEASSQALETSLQALHRAVEQLRQALTELKAAEAHQNR